MLTGAVLAGCVTDDEAQPQSDPEPTEAVVTAETGGIEGTLTTDEGLPLEGAQIGIIELEMATRSDAGGKFAMSEVPPGTYTLFAQRLGYQAKSARATVAAEEITEVTMVLSPLPVAEPRQNTVIWNGFVKCSLAVRGLFWSEECGEGVGTPVGTFGKDPNNKIDYDWDIPERPETVLTETTWEPSTTAASAMRVIFVSNLVCDPFCGWDDEYGDESGGPPVRIQADKMPSDGYPLNVTLRHWATWTADGDDEVILLLEQRFEVYKTEFYGLPLEDEEWTAIPA